jgi:hypothetical protein
MAEQDANPWGGDKRPAAAHSTGQSALITKLTASGDNLVKGKPVEK